MNDSNIQWCDSTTNPAMGCEKQCELWPSRFQIINALLAALEPVVVSVAPRGEFVCIFGKRAPSDIYEERRRLAEQIVMMCVIDNAKRRKIEEYAAKTISACFRCYAGILHLRYGANHSGYSPKFERVTLFPGRTAKAASLPDLQGRERIEKPWLNGLPRLLFISDMGDLLSPSVPFDYIDEELIGSVTSPHGRRHIWLWLTKQPNRMADFSEWLRRQGRSWPKNLVAMTSVTSSKTLWRIRALERVDCRLRGLSVEPLWNSIELPLKGIDWVIVGGESGHSAKPFDLVWAREIREQCRRSGAAFFLKQLGTRAFENGQRLKLIDRHGGDWTEWPEDLRVRQFPNAISHLVRGEDDPACTSVSAGTASRCGLIAYSPSTKRSHE